MGLKQMNWNWVWIMEINLWMNEFTIASKWNWKLNVEIHLEIASKLKICQAGSNEAKY